MSHPLVMLLAMVTIAPTTTSPRSPAAATPTLVVVDPADPGVVHASGGCADLSAVIDLVERATGIPVECADAYDAALAELGLLVGLNDTLGLTACMSCWAA